MPPQLRLLLALLLNAGGFAFFLGEGLTTPQNPGALLILAYFATWVVLGGVGFVLMILALREAREPHSRDPQRSLGRAATVLKLSIFLMVVSFVLFVALVTIPCQPACVGGGGEAGGGAGGNAVAGPSCGGTCEKPLGFVAALMAEVLSVILVAIAARSLWKETAPRLSTVATPARSA